MASTHRVAVVGGGIAGLAAADVLASKVDLTLFELSGHLGGKIRGGDVDGIRVDEGAESFLVRRPEAATLARELGLRVVHPRTSLASVLVGDRLRPLPEGTQLGIPGDLVALARSGVLAPHQLVRVVLGRLLATKPLSTDVSVGDVVSAQMGRAVVDRLVEPLLGGVYAGRADGISLAMALPKLFEAMRSESSLLSATRRIQAETPAQKGPVFGSIDGGADRLTGTLADRIVARGGTIVVDRGVMSLERHDGAWSVGFHGGEESFDAIILACPGIASSRLLTAAAPESAGLLAPLEYASVAIVNLVYDSERVPSLNGSGYLAADHPGRIVKAVTFVSNKWDRPHPDRFVVRASVGRAGDTAALALADGELAAQVHTELAAVLGIAGGAQASKVTRWGGALPQYAPGHQDRVLALRAALPPGISVAGAAYDGVGIPACIGSGRSAAEEVLRHLGHE